MGRAADDARDDDPDAGPDDARRAEPLLIWVLAVTGLAHLLAVIGQHAFVYTDSIDYETLDFSGRSRRPWVTPLLYQLVSDPAVRIAAQGLIGALCWGFLALQVARLADDRRVRWCLLLAVLALSLTTTVTNWDTAILSESLAISCTALLLGALARYARVPSFAAAAVVLAAWVLWIWTRQNHLVLGLLVTGAVAAVLAWSLLRRRAVQTSLVALLAGMLLLTGLAGLTYSRNTEIVHFNLALVIGNRVLPDAGRTAWYVERGMPVPDGVVIGQPRSPQDLLADDEFDDWIADDGIAVYAQDLALHPWQTLTEPLDSMVSDRPPFGELHRRDEVMLAGPDSYGVAREVLPAFVEDLLFDPGDAGMVVLLLAVVLTWTLLEWRRRGADPRWTLPLLALAVQVPALMAVFHASTAELARLALPSALIVRIVLLVQLALLVDRWLSEGSPLAFAPSDEEPVDDEALDDELDPAEG